MLHFNKMRLPEIIVYRGRKGYHSLTIIYLPESFNYPLDDSLSGGPHLVTSLPPDASSFSPLPLGVRLVHTIPSYSYWNFQLEQTESGYIQFAFSIPRGSSIGESETSCGRGTDACLFRAVCSEERNTQSDYQ